MPPFSVPSNTHAFERRNDLRTASLHAGRPLLATLRLDPGHHGALFIADGGARGGQGPRSQRHFGRKFRRLRPMASASCPHCCRPGWSDATGVSGRPRPCCSRQPECWQWPLSAPASPGSPWPPSYWGWATAQPPRQAPICWCRRHHNRCSTWLCHCARLVCRSAASGGTDPASPGSADWLRAASSPSLDPSCC